MNKKVIILSLIIIVLIIGAIVLFPETAKETYAYTTDDTLVDVVISEAGSNVGWEANASGVFKTPEGDYRYVGGTVNNYVSFNNDMYRIIGVFDEKSHGQENQMVKLIRNRILGSYSWGIYNYSVDPSIYQSYRNDWTGNTRGKANANVLLNDFFYKKSFTDPVYGSCIDWTYYGDGYTKIYDCTDIVGYGIDSTLQGYISDARWYLYGYNTAEFSKQQFYQCERGLSEDTTNCLVAGVSPEQYSEYGDAKIGLMYASDFLYASSRYSSEDSTLATVTYGSQNWLINGYEWTITPLGGRNQNAFRIIATGNLSGLSTASSMGIRPTFYLKPEVYYTGGSGTFDDPYTIGCDTCNE